MAKTKKKKEWDREKERKESGQREKENKKIRKKEGRDSERETCLVRKERKYTIAHVLRAIFPFFFTSLSDCKVTSSVIT